jgi:hypothetical protein
MPHATDRDFSLDRSKQFDRINVRESRRGGPIDAGADEVTRKRKFGGTDRLGPVRPTQRFTPNQRLAQSIGIA